MNKIKITDKFWRNYRTLVKEEMIPYQWKVLNDAIDIHIEKERDDDFIPTKKSHAIENFKIAAGLAKGKHYGWVFQDSDVYKWLEAVAYSLRDMPDPDLQKMADAVVDLIAMAQEKDGYLDTYFTIMEPERKFKRLSESHELYCAGHYMEAAVAYYQTTGNEKALDVAKKLADCIDANFGREEGKCKGYDGHEEVEIGLMKLYRLTKNERYLKLASFFLEERGKNPNFFREQNEKDHGAVLLPGLAKFPDTYFQNQGPVREQKTAEGHAVRLVYLCTAMADLAAATKDEELLTACRNIWNNIVQKRMYVTGGIGSTVIGESFTLDYDLPNDTMYCETCASVGLVFFAKKMLEADPNGMYADVMERALYNSVISGMALDGKHFFYVNPLESNPKKYKKDPTKSHVKPVRPQWLGCACCPPNLARMMTSLEDYIYTVKDGVVYANLFVQSEAETGGLHIDQSTAYPYEGEVKFQVKKIDMINKVSANEENSATTLAVRIPAWSETTAFFVNGEEVNVKEQKGYAFFTLSQDEAEITLRLAMSVRRIYASSRVSEDIGKVCIIRGPLIYCAEEVDNGGELHTLYLREEHDSTEPEYHAQEEADFHASKESDACAQKELGALTSRCSEILAVKETACEELGGAVAITLPGKRLVQEGEDLYFYGREHLRYENTDIKLIPYFAWANRGENEMRVWLAECPS